MDEFNMENIPNEQPQASENNQAPATDEKKGLRIASLVLGIISVVFSCAWYIAIPCGIIGLILGIVAAKSGKNGMSTAGIVLSVIGIIVAIVWLIVVAVILTEYINLNM